MASARLPTSSVPARRSARRICSTAATCVAATSSTMPSVPIIAAASPMPRRSTLPPRIGMRFTRSGSPANGVKARRRSRRTEMSATAIRLPPIPKIVAVARRLSPSVITTDETPTTRAIAPATTKGEAPERSAGIPNRRSTTPVTVSARSARAPTAPAIATTAIAKSARAMSSAPPLERSATA